MSKVTPNKLIAILIMFNKGYSYRQIAKSIGVSPNTIDYHLSTILEDRGRDDLERKCMCGEWFSRYNYREYDSDLSEWTLVSQERVCEDCLLKEPY